MKADSDLYRTKSMEALFNNSLNAIASLDERYSIVNINKSFITLFGYTLPEVKGMHIDDVMNMGKKGSANSRQTRDIISGKTINEEGIRYNKSGEPIHVLIRGYPIMIDGKMAGAYAIYSDISERKEAEEKILESEARIKAILSALPDLFFINNREGVFLDYHAPDENQLLVKPEAFLDKNYRELFPPELVKKYEKAYNQINETGKNQIIEYAVENQEEKLYYEARLTLIDSERILTIVRDITESKVAEIALRESEKELHEAQHIAKMGRWQLDLIKNHLHWSPTIFEIFEIDPHKFTATYEGFIEKIHPDDREMVNQAYTQSVEDRKPYSIEHRLLMKDGRIKWVSERCYTKYDNNNKALRSVGVVQDITERKQAELRIKENNVMLASLNKYTTRQAETRNYEDLIKMIADQLTEYSRAIFVAFNEYNPHERKLILKNIKSEQKIIDLAVRLGGKGLLNVITPVNEKMYREVTADVVGFRQTLNEITQGVVPVFISRAIQKATGINHYTYLSHIVEDQLYGTTIIGLASQEETPPLEFLESYAHISAISLRRLQAEEKIRHMGYHDTLTGLYNRNYLDEEMSRFDTKRQLPLSLIMADLNGLKLINDTYGHLLGDQALQAAAKIIKSASRAEDLIARWGGDEFVILLPQTTAEQAWQICNRINSYSASYKIENIPISLAMGVAEKNTADKNLYEVLMEAENNMYRQKLTESRSAKNALLKSLLKALEAKSYETEMHTRGMHNIAQEIGKTLKLTDEEMKRLELLITLHDIGKINISEEILTKNSDLNKDEWEEIKRHPEIGYRIARSTEEFAHVAEDILAHHERWDGSGYPYGLKGEEIPLLARITAIADAYEVMSNGRPYKQAISEKDIVEEFQRCAGTQFDPSLVKLMLSILSRH